MKFWKIIIRWKGSQIKIWIKKLVFVAIITLLIIQAQIFTVLDIKEKW